MARLKFMNTEIDNLTMQETLQAIDSIIQEKRLKKKSKKLASNPILLAGAKAVMLISYLKKEKTFNAFLSHAQGQICIGKQFDCLCLGEAHE